MNIGEASAVITLLGFIDPNGEDRADVEKVTAQVRDLRDRAAKALQVSGPHIISDDELWSALVFTDTAIEDYQEFTGTTYSAPTRPVVDVDTKGRV